MSRPNVLFFLTDDQRFDTIHALGNRDISTPNLDRLVQSGTTFTHACTMGGTITAVCVPSRAMLLTGRTLFRLQGNGAAIPEQHITLPEALRREGYRTHHIGKWHQDRDSFNRSFTGADRIFGFTEGRHGWYNNFGGHWNVAVHDFDPSGNYPCEMGYILAQDKATRLPLKAGVGGVHSSEIFADAAVEFLGRRAQEERRTARPPFFLYVAFTAPHYPRQSPDEFEEIYRAETLPLPPNFMPRHPFDNGELLNCDERLEGWPRRPHAVRRHIADYYAMISHVDAHIGRVVETLKETGELDNTIIVFAGDNGLALGQHGLMGKQNLYEHSIRVPLILSGPGIPRGKRYGALCYLLDVFPTLVDLLKIPVPDSVDGRSLTPVMRGEQETIRESQYYAYRGVQRAVRDVRFKLIEYAAGGGERVRQLFDLQEDPYELVNLGEDPDQRPTRERLAAELLKQGRDVDECGHEEAKCFWKNKASA